MQKNKPVFKYKPSNFMLPTSHYDKVRADRAVMFIQFLKHTKGIWAGKPFFLFPWQEQIIDYYTNYIQQHPEWEFVKVYKKIIASEHGDGTIFELDCGLYALCKHSRSADRAWYACHAGVFMGAYSEFIPADQLPDGICNEDIAVLETVEKLEAVNGMSRDKRRALEQLQENIKNRPDYLVWREEGLK